MGLLKIAYKFRLYPTKAQAAILHGQVNAAATLYNAALQERRDAWRMARISIGLKAQCAQLKEIGAAGNLGLASTDAAHDVLRRVDRAFGAFYRRAKSKARRVGYPRFRSARRYDSITFPHDDCGWKILPNGRLRVQGVGHVKMRQHRPTEGTLKNCTIKREGAHWYTIFVAEREPKPMPESRRVIGLDLGLSSFVTLSDGTQIANGRFSRRAERRFRVAQRRLSRRRRGGQRREKARALLAAAWRGVSASRADFQHKLSRRLVNDYGVICAENLNVQGLASGMLARSVRDASWSSFLSMLAYKAADAGRRLVLVNPRGTSQACSGCGQHVPKTLSQRWHSCDCGAELDRDHNAARNILKVGLEKALGCQREATQACA